MLLAVSIVSTAWAEDRPYFNQARAVFDALPVRDRNEAFLELMATGDFNAMASNQFGTRIYDATASFQDQNGIVPSGVLTPETRGALSDIGGRIFNSWGFEFLDHPVASVALAVPGAFGFDKTTTSHGLALRDRRNTMNVSFAFFPEGEATLDGVFDNLTRPSPDRQIDMKVIRPDFLAVAGHIGATSHYSRYIPVPGGIAGFTIAWNSNAYPNAGRIAVVMANELYPHRMSGEDMFANLPGGASPISPGSDSESVQRQSEAQEQARRQAELDRQQAQTRYLEQIRQAQEEADKKRKIEDDARQAAEEGARVAREAETVRRAKLEAARQVALRQLKADRLANAKSAVEGPIKDAVEFVKANRDDPQLVEHLQQIADLNAAAGGSEPESIDRTRADLQARLNADPVYAAWEARQLAERQRENDRTLREVVQALTVQRKFLVDRVAEDPIAVYAGGFLPLAKQADAAIAAPALDAAQSLMGTIDGAIDKAGLHDSYTLAKADAAKFSGAEISQMKTTANTIKP